MQTPSRVFDLLKYQLDHYPMIDAVTELNSLAPADYAEGGES